MTKKSIHYLFVLLFVAFSVQAQEKVTVYDTYDEFAKNVLIEDENGRFCGIVSNADVRKTMLKHWTNLDGIAESDFVNATPFSVNENATVREMLKTIEAIGRVILFLPVINNNNELTGLVPLNNLAKG